MGEGINYKGFRIIYRNIYRGYVFFKIGGDERDGLVTTSVEDAKDIIDSVIKKLAY